MSDESASVILIAALKIEIKPLLSGFKLSTSDDQSIYKGRIGNREIYAFVSGDGKNAAIHAANRAVRKKPGLVLNIGFAGGLNPSLRGGDLFIPEEIRNINGKALSCNPCYKKYLGEDPSGVLLTSEVVVSTRGEKRGLSSLADAVDMESFFIASFLESEKIPYYCLKGITDPADESLPLDFSPAISNGKVSGVKVLSMLAGKPQAVFPLAKLACRSQVVTRRLCRLAHRFLSSLEVHA